jgi:hypothetical protein
MLAVTAALAFSLAVPAEEIVPAEWIRAGGRKLLFVPEGLKKEEWAETLKRFVDVQDQPQA